jgi:hypothetical protein
MEIAAKFALHLLTYSLGNVVFLAHILTPELN